MSSTADPGLVTTGGNVPAGEIVIVSVAVPVPVKLEALSVTG